MKEKENIEDKVSQFINKATKDELKEKFPKAIKEFILLLEQKEEEILKLKKQNTYMKEQNATDSYQQIAPFFKTDDGIIINENYGMYTGINTSTINASNTSISGITVCYDGKPSKDLF